MALDLFLRTYFALRQLRRLFGQCGALINVKPFPKLCMRHVAHMGACCALTDAQIKDWLRKQKEQRE